MPGEIVQLNVGGKRLVYFHSYSENLHIDFNVWFSDKLQSDSTGQYPSLSKQRYHTRAEAGQGAREINKG